MKLLLVAAMVLSVVELSAADDGKPSSCSSPRCAPDPGSETAFSASSPRFNAEEAYSAHMPQHLRCDACTAIAFQLQEHLARAEAKRPSAKVPGARLSESEYMEALERSCSQSWEKLYKLCQSYLGDFGEEQIYEEYRRRPDALAEFLCSGEQRACARPSDAQGGSLNEVKAVQSEL